MSLRSLLLGFALAVISLFVVSAILLPRATVRMGVPKRMTTAEAWAISANNASEMGKSDLLKTMYESEIPDASDAVRNTFSSLSPSRTSIELLHSAFVRGDARTKYHAMHGLYNIGNALGMKMRERGIEFPAYARFQADTELYIAKWQAWLDKGYPELLERQGSLR